MRSLTDTIARLSALRMRPDPFSPPVHRLKDLPEFGSNPGALRAKYYLPDNCRADAPLVVVLHGCLQTAEGYNLGSGWSQLADENGFALLFPEQRRINNPNFCFNWFLPDDMRAGSGEVMSIRQMIERMVLDHSLNRNRIFITGLSAGGAMAGALLANYPDVFAGGGIIAGVPFGSATTVQQAFDRMRGHGEASAEVLGDLVRNATTHGGRWPRISIWHGDADQIVAPSNGAAITGQWRSVHQLADKPDRTDVVGGHVHRVWLDAKGDAAVEEYVITGVGHGTPLLTGEGGYGAAGDYMLEAGISSTQRIAAFWGIAPALSTNVRVSAKSAAYQATPDRTVPLPRRTAATPPTRVAPPGPRATRMPKSPARPVDTIRSVIEDALRGAGWMK